MKKQLQQELRELAVTILKEEVLSTELLKEKASKIYEQAIILAYAEKNEGLENNSSIKEKANVDSVTPLPEVSNKIEEIKIQLIVKETEVFKDDKEENKEEELPTFEIEEGVLGMTFEPSEKMVEIQKIEQPKVVITSIEPEETPTEAPALLHELENLTKDFDLPDFEPMQIAEVKEIENKNLHQSNVPKSKVSLNDTLGKRFQIGLNDRLAFVNQLFGGNQQDYTRVISQLNTVENLEEAQQFIAEIIKPEYNNWEGKEAFEVRFLDLVERNFQD